MVEELLSKLGNTQDGVLVVDADQRILTWNQGAEQILGYPAEAVLGRPCDEIIAGSLQNGTPVCTRACAVMALARRGGVPPTQTCRSVTCAGAPRWLSLTHIALPGEGGAPCMVHIFRDITRQVEAQDLIERLGAYLQAAPAARPPALAESAGRSSTVLTLREVEVLQLLAAGHSTRQIADRLVVSISTARNHIQNILDRLHVHSRLEAVSYALQHHIIEAPQGSLPGSD